MIVRQLVRDCMTWTSQEKKILLSSQNKIINLALSGSRATGGDPQKSVVTLQARRYGGR